MFEFFNRVLYPLGIDVSRDTIKLVQLAKESGKLCLLGCAVENRPQTTACNGSSWQKWAIESLKSHSSKKAFKGKDAAVMPPSNDVFIDYVKVSKVAPEKFNEVVLSRIKHKLPYPADLAVTKFIATEDDNVLVMAMEKNKIEQYLSIFEQAAVKVKSINVWPAAIVNCYTSFFARRKEDVQSIVMLIDIDTEQTNLVISRYKTPLFVSTIATGANSLKDEQAINHLAGEIENCKKRFFSLYRAVKIERLIFLSGQIPGKYECLTIAKKLEIPAQIAELLAAVEIKNQNSELIDRRGQQANLAPAFGLSLSN